MKVKTILVSFFLCIAAFVVTAKNIFGFPMMVGDEGIYVSQAWWLVHFHQLGPYTYWYDHFPLGWLQIGVWQLITGNPFRFGISVFSGRIFMAILKAVSAIFLFLTAKRITKSSVIALGASILFIVSSLALTFNRLVLLDNVASFWLLVHLWFLSSQRISGRNSLLTSLTLAIAILSKESLLFLLPVYIFFVFRKNRSERNKSYYVLISLLVLFFSLSFFPLLALLKGELFSAAGQVSFVDALRFQSTRGMSYPIWDRRSDFAQMLSMWLTIDPTLILIGAGAVITNILFSWKNHTVRTIALYAAFFMLFLARGGLVYNFYIIPLIPLFVLNIAYAVSSFMTLIRNKLFKVFTALILLCLYVPYISYDQDIFHLAATKNQKASIEYSRDNIPDSASVVVDNYAYLDLAVRPDGTIKNPNVQWYSKAESDSAVKEKIFNSDPSKVDYLLVNDSLNAKISASELPFLAQVKERLNSSKPFGASLPLNARPFSGEGVILYSQDANEKIKEETSPEAKVDRLFILTFDGPELTEEDKTFLSTTSPYAIMIGFQNVANTSQLESLMHELSSVKNQSTQLMIHQSDTGKISIPWISTALRSSYKSPLEAAEATRKKVKQLASLGFQSAVVTGAVDSDGYLQAITDSSTAEKITPLLESDTPSGAVTNFPNLILVNKSNAQVTAGDHNRYGTYLEKNASPEGIRAAITDGYTKIVVNMKEYEQIRSKILEIYQSNTEFREKIDSL